MQPYRPPKPQEPIQPGSSQVLAGSTARFLAYNQLGCVVSKEVDDHHVIEVGGMPGDRQDRGAGKGVQELLGPAARAGCISTEPHMLLSLSDDLSRIQLLPSRKKYVLLDTGTLYTDLMRREAGWLPRIHNGPLSQRPRCQQIFRAANLGTLACCIHCAGVLP
jgi:hypothetical protein